ncbi:DUF5906 domain-containing protein [Vibrio cortegadensis]|uniref:primase-helicase family protein n=1 Tax=Vibrio cortegadensis TaxID=1328770 RepID=UPI0021C32703|nr:primase-helicase family protein [Vibrio cortegadensis]MDN3696394.1 DUF5906 domain-containing protein [Vibrio cortegadensis]
MDVMEELAAEASKNEWVSRLKAEGWFWFEDDKPQPRLWNHRTDTSSSVSNMKTRAIKADLKPSDAIYALQRRLPLVSGTRFMPNKSQFISENGCNFVNTFKAWKEDDYKPQGDAKTLAQILEQPFLPEDPLVQKMCVEPFIELINRLTIGSGDTEWLMCWMAHMIQKPEERPSVHPLFRTEHGVGKNVLVERVLNKLLCKQTVTTNLKEIRGTHSESVANNLLVFVDESKAKGMNVYLEMKSLLTTSEVLVNPKHVRPYKQEIFSRFMFADNTQGRAFNIEQEDRRIYVMAYVIHEIDKEDTQEFIGEFLDWFSVSWELVHGYLLNYDISKWSPHSCPMTEAKKEYLAMCEDPVEQIIKEYRNAGWESIDEGRWNSLIIGANLGENFIWSKLSQNTSFKYQLEDAGYQKKRVGRSKATGYFLDGLKGEAAYAVLIDERERFTRAGDSIDEQASQFSV